MSQEEVKQDLTKESSADEKLEEKIADNDEQKATSTERQQNNSYTIRITPDKTDDVKVFTITRSMAKYLASSVIILLVLVIASLGFAGYAYINNKSDKEHIQKLQEANALQQEQLSQLDKKANSLQQDVDELTNLENELKQLSGISTDDNDKANSTGDEVDTNVDSTKGQGGAYPEGALPTIDSVRTTLNNVEYRLNGKKNNMEQLKNSLQKAIIMKRQEVAFQNQTISITPSIWPSSGVVSSPYGLRWGGSDFHPGIDIADDMGTPIHATADGAVSVAGWNSGGYGNMVDIDHGNGVMTRYGHASYVVVNAGQRVKRGQIIAYMGSTGFSTGPHVHYEVRVNGQAVDPAGYLFNK